MNKTMRPWRTFAKYLGQVLAVASCAPSVFARTASVSVGPGGTTAFVDAQSGTSTTTIYVGDTVQWAWVGSVFHSTTSGTCSSACTPDNIWDSGQHSSPYTYSRVFGAVGTFHYFCTVHTVNMQGTIIVRPPPGPVRLRIFPPDHVLANAATEQYRAFRGFFRGMLQEGGEKEITSIAGWQSSNQNIATILPTGFATAANSGTGTTIISAVSGPYRLGVPLTVSSATLTSISVTPSNPTIPLGLSLQLYATGTFSDGTAHDLTFESAWSSSAPGTATVNKSGQVNSVAQGPATISATVNAVSGSTVVTVGPPPPVNDSLGTAVGAPLSPCPPSNLAGNVCYSVTVSCPGVADVTPAVKVITPAGTLKGTIIFGVGGGGTGWYDEVFTFGAQVINNVVQAGFTVAEINFRDTTVGWLTGPGGPRKLACRYATAAKWIYDNIHQVGASAPLCATGNSGGSGAVAYALAHYGLGSIFAMVEPTSGPPFGRIDHGCICNQPPVLSACGQQLTECYGTYNATTFLDPAYGSNVCSQAMATGDTTNQNLFLQDSIASPDARFNYPTTDVHVLYGSQDMTSAPPQGMDWISNVTSKKTITCVPNTPHEIANSTEGRDQLSTDLINFCKLQ